MPYYAYGPWKDSSHDMKVACTVEETWCGFYEKIKDLLQFQNSNALSKEQIIYNLANQYLRVYAYP